MPIDIVNYQECIILVLQGGGCFFAPEFVELTHFTLLHFAVFICTITWKMASISKYVKLMLC
jgi:hypothetical protein